MEAAEAVWRNSNMEGSEPLDLILSLGEKKPALPRRIQAKKPALPNASSCARIRNRVSARGGQCR